MEGTQINVANQILTKYLEMFNHNSYDFKYHFAKNSVIDWYGRQIRGVQKVHDHLRYEVFLHFEHSEFREAKVCDPIEKKPTHMTTQKITDGNRRNALAKKRKCIATSLKLHADSDLESDDEKETVGEDTLHQSTQIIRGKSNDLLSEEKVLPVSMKRGMDTSPTEHCSVKFSKYYKDQKYVKTELLDRLSCSPQIPNNSGIAERNNSSNDLSSEDDDFKQIEYTYTPLQYLEATGSLIARPANAKDAIDDYRPVNDSPRETRLRISYRCNIKNKDIQFALVIYEDTSPTFGFMHPRRNLLSEFSDLAEEHNKHSLSTANDDYDSGDLQNVSTSISTTLEIDPEDLESPAMMSISQMRTPTKQTLTPAATPKRRSRTSMRRNSITKRLNTSPKSSCNKRCTAARSLRL